MPNVNACHGADDVTISTSHVEGKMTTKVPFFHSDTDCWF